MGVHIEIETEAIGKDQRQIEKPKHGQGTYYYADGSKWEGKNEKIPIERKIHNLQ